MIKLFQFPAGKKLPNFSPFCMKLETYMRMAKIPFEIVSTVNLNAAPKKQLPYIIDGNIKLGDSGFIIEYLCDKYGDILNDHLTPKEKAISRAIQSLCEDHFYWPSFYGRWVDPRNWPQTKHILFSKLPWWLRHFVAYRIRQRSIKAFRHTKFGRHTRDEIYALGCQDVDALVNYLGSNEYIMGHTPTAIDATVYAFVANTLFAPFSSPIQTYALAQPKLIEYCERMRKRFYPH